MKRLEVTTIIKECSDCPYANIWGLFCNRYKRKLPDKLDGAGQHYSIPDWCDLDELTLPEEFVPELVICDFIRGHCIGASCICVDHETSEMKKDPIEIRFKCKNYGVWIVRK